MDLAAPHLGFVIASYGLSLVVIAGLAGYVIWRDRALARRVKALEDKGLGRRSRP